MEVHLNPLNPSVLGARAHAMRPTSRGTPLCTSHSLDNLHVMIKARPYFHSTSGMATVLTSSVDITSGKNGVRKGEYGTKPYRNL